MSDTSYINRMEDEYKELHKKFEGLRAYLAKPKQPVAEPVHDLGCSNTMAAPANAGYNELENNLLHDQFYAMEGYLRSLGGRIQLAKAKEGLL